MKVTYSSHICRDTPSSRDTKQLEGRLVNFDPAHLGFLIKQWDAGGQDREVIGKEGYDFWQGLSRERENGFNKR